MHSIPDEYTEGVPLAPKAPRDVPSASYGPGAGILFLGPLISVTLWLVIGSVAALLI